MGTAIGARFRQQRLNSARTVQPLHGYLTAVGGGAASIQQRSGLRNINLRRVRHGTEAHVVQHRRRCAPNFQALQVESHSVKSAFVEVNQVGGPVRRCYVPAKGTS